MKKFLFALFLVSLISSPAFGQKIGDIRVGDWQPGTGGGAGPINGAGAAGQVAVFSGGLTVGGSANLTFGSALTSSVPFVGPVGSAAAPSHSFTGDLDTGMYSAGADQINWATGGTLRLSLSSSALTVPSGMQVLLPDGTGSAPSIGRSAGTNTGIFFAGAATVTTSAGTAGFYTTNTETKLPAGASFGFTSGAVTATGLDAFLSREAAATLQMGADVTTDADATDQVLAAADSTGAAFNRSGGDLTLQSGAGVGSGAGSAIILQTPTAGAGGSGAQSLATRLMADSAGVYVYTSGTTAGFMVDHVNLGLYLGTAYKFGWGTSATAGGGVDLYLSREAAATLQMGADSTSAAVNQTLKAMDYTGTGNNTAGGNLSLKCGLGSGTGACQVALSAPTLQASGNTLQTTQVDRVVVNNVGMTIGPTPGTHVVLFPFTGTTNNTPDYTATGKGLGFYSYLTTQTGVYGFSFTGPTAPALSSASGANAHMHSGRTFAPTSGTGTYAGYLLADTINQTGGANGITRGLYVNPTLTAAADYRPIEVERAGLATTSADGLVLSNATAATGGATVQMSPRQRWVSQAWNTAASQTVAFHAEVLPTSAATPTGTWRLGYQLDAGAVTYPLTVTSVGTVTASGQLSAGTNIVAGAGYGVFATATTTTGAKLSSPADGVGTLTNFAASGFTRLNLGGTTSSFPALGVSGAGIVLQQGDGTQKGLLTIPQDNIGPVSTDGLVLSNSTAGTAGTYQYSPRLAFRAGGWETGTPAAVDGRAYIALEPVTSSSPSGATRLNFGISVNGGSSYIIPMYLDQNGIKTSQAFCPYLACIYGPASGVLRVSNLAGTDFVRLTFGGETTAYPALGRTGAGLVVQQGDGTQTGLLTIPSNNIATTSTDGLVLSNSQASTVGVPVQYGPRIRWQHQVWDTDGSSDTYDWKIEPQGTSAATTASSLVFSAQKNSGGYSAATVSISNGGVVNAVGGFVSQTGFYFAYGGSSQAALSNQVAADGTAYLTTPSGPTTTPAGLHMSRVVETVAATKNPSAIESNELYATGGDSDGAAYTLPNDPSVTGLTYTIVVDTTQASGNVSVAPSTGESINWAGSSYTTSCTSTQLGSAITITNTTSGSGAKWVVTAVTGTWTCS